MKNILRFAAATILACAAIACSESGITEENPGPGNGAGQGTAEPFYITASFDNETLDSRVAVDDPGNTAIKFKWEVGDVIHVVNSTANANAKAYAFEAVEVQSEGLTATFKSPADFPEGETPAVAMWYGKSWTGTQYNPTQVGDVTAFATADKLMDAYWLYAKFDAQSNKLSFKPLLSILRFDLTLPASQTAINSLRIQTQDGTQALPIDPRFDITGANPVLNSASVYNFFSDNLNIPLVDNRAVVYLCVGPMTQAEGKTLEIIVNKTQYITQTLHNIAGGKVAPITKPGKTKAWENAVYSGGIGTDVIPYLVSNETNLRSMATKTDSGTNYAGTNFQLENDLSISTSASTPWTPIGNTVTPFLGNFDGTGKTITQNLQHFAISAGGLNYGIFGYVGVTGKVSNLNVAGTVVANTGDAYSMVGGISGVVAGTIQNCTSTCNVTGSNTTAAIEAGVGGIAGGMHGKMIGCKQLGGSITMTLSQTSGGAEAGGLIGYMAQPGNVHMSKVEGATKIYASSNNTALCYVGAMVGYASAYGGSTYIYKCSTYGTDTQLFKNGAATELIIDGAKKVVNTDCADPEHQYSGGIGTEANPYLLANAHDLWKLSASANGLTYDGVTYTATSYAGKYFKMTQDITLNATESNPWIPFGDVTAFEGNFDGNGKTISGTIYSKGTNYASILGAIKNNTIRNLNVSAALTLNNKLTGGIASQATSSKISSCSFSGSISAPTIAPMVCGGIVGITSTVVDTPVCVVVNCTVRNTVFDLPLGITRLGGIVGTHQSGTMHTCKLENSTFKLTTLTTYLGGISGYTGGTNLIYDCCTMSGNTLTVGGVSQTLNPIGSGSFTSDPGHTEPTL